MITVIHVLTKAEFRSHLQNNESIESYYATAAGEILVRSTDLGIYDVEFVDEYKGALAKQIDADNIILVGTDFQLKVWKATMDIPSGEILSYHDLAHAIGHDKSYRAVANALGANKLAYFIPCHRVIRKSGDIGGYAYGADKKAALLRSETLLKEKLRSKP